MKSTKKRKGKLIGIAYGTPSDRKSAFAREFENYAKFLNERKKIKKYSYNPRDIHERVKTAKRRKGKR